MSNLLEWMMVGKISVKLGMASGRASFLIGTNLTACPEDWHFNQVNICSRVIINLLSLLLRLMLIQHK